METVGELGSWRRWRASAGEAAKSIGFVPTMGALHAGHISLVSRARSENELLVASIFVNPTQFDEANDFEAYPRDLDSDAEKLAASGVDVLLIPRHEDIYHDEYRYRVSETELAAEMEGACRPGHFEGVLTVVMKLLCLVRPHRAYFGEKDYQQYRLIRGMTEAFFVPTEIIACPTIREDDGLAYSSRNRRLSPDSRSMAPEFYRLLRQQIPAHQVHASLEAAGFEVEYVCERDGRRYAAVRLEGTRLIDNLPIDPIS